MATQANTVRRSNVALVLFSLCFSLLLSGCWGKHSDDKLADDKLAADKPSGDKLADDVDADHSDMLSGIGDVKRSRQAAAATPPHDRMVAALEKIRLEGRYERMFYGDEDLELEEAGVAHLGKSSKVAQYDRLYRVGKRRLWRGDTLKAIAHLESAWTLAREFVDEIGAEQLEKATFQLGLAYLRLGENENCVNCNNGESCLIPIRAAGIHTDQTGSRNAIRYFQLVLAANPQHLEAKWLLNIAHMTLGEYPEKVPPEFLISPSKFESDVEFPRFENVATTFGLNRANLSGGSVVDDFDGDGDLDIVTSSWGASDQILYFRNEGKQFVDATAEANLSGIFGGLNLVHADYDNDGDNDVLVLRGAWMQHEGNVPNSLLQNDGSGRFEDVTFTCGIGDKHHATQTAAWLDFDNDGDLDIFIGNENVACELFKNDGTGHFVDVAATAGVTNMKYTKGVTCGDFNGDNYPDIYVSNLNGPNRLYQNNGDGTFLDVAEKLKVAGPAMSFPTWFWDFNQDGILDIFVTSYSYDLSYVGQKYFDKALNATHDSLYQGDGAGGFVDVAEAQLLTAHTQPMGSNFGDLNNDGYPDFYLGTGYPGYEGLMPNLMYLNQRGGGFADVTTAGGFGHLQKGHGVAFADIDHDGDQDVFSQMGGAYPGDVAANCLYLNPGFGNHWITIKLAGTASNRSAIGARIKLDVMDSGESRTIYKWVNSGGSFGSNPLRQEIGLGGAELIQRLEIFWPTTGETQTFTDVAVDQIVRITEGLAQMD
jgi:hypothetical protein